MGLLHIYNTLDGTSKAHRANGKLKDILPDLDFTHSIILKAGERLTKDYEVKEDDILYIRKTPADPVTVGIVVGLGVVVATGAVIGAIHNNNARLKEEQEKAQRNAQNLAQQVEQLPFVKGAKNRSALGNMIQYQLGYMYNTPYLITDGFYNVTGLKGENQYYNAVMSLGYGNLELYKILLGDVDLVTDENGLASGKHYFKNDSIYYDPESFVEIAAMGEDFTTPEFKNKVLLTQDGSELKHDFDAPTDPKDPSANGGTPVIKQVADYTKTLEVCIEFNGLRYYDSELEAWQSRSVEVVPYWSNDDGATWHKFYFENTSNNTISANSKNTIRFVARKTFTAAESYGKKLLLKVVKTTPKMESNSNEDCYLAYYQSYCYDNAKSNNTTLVDCELVEPSLKNKLYRVGIRVKANESTNGQLDSLHCIGSSLARTWDGENWSTEKSATSNPAALILEVLTSNAHKPSQMQDSEIELSSLGALYEHCETNGYKCDYILTSSLKKVDLIKNILKTCNADMVINEDGLYSFVIDKKEDIPVALINSENIKTINYTKDFKRKPDGVKVTYIGESWQPETFYCMLDGGTKSDDDIVIELNLDYVTNYEHAYKLAQRYLRGLILQPRSFSVDVGREGDYYPLYSTILLQHKEFRQGLTSSIIKGFIYNDNNEVTGIKIAENFNFVAGFNYGVVIQAVSEYGKKVYYRKITSSGRTNILTFNEPINSAVMPELFNTCSIGLLNENDEFDTITNTMKISGISNGSDGITLTLLDYNPAIYEYGDIPEYKPNITRTPTATGLTIPPVQIVEGIKGERGEAGASSFTYLGTISHLEDIPESTNGDFFLCGQDFSQMETFGTDKGELFVKVDGALDNLGVMRKFLKGIIYFSQPNGTWKAVFNKNDYRYTVAQNDLINLTGDASPALFEPLGVDVLEDKKIIDPETKTIKADLIDANTIKGITGLFDNITSNDSTFNTSTIYKAKLQNTFLALTSAYTLSITNANTSADILSQLETIRNDIYNKFADKNNYSFGGTINGYCKTILNITYKNNAGAGSLYLPPTSVLRIRISLTELEISIPRNTAFYNINGDIQIKPNQDFKILYDKSSNTYSIQFDTEINFQIPRDSALTDGWSVYTNIYF